MWFTLLPGNFPILAGFRLQPSPQTVPARLLRIIDASNVRLASSRDLNRESMERARGNTPRREPYLPVRRSVIRPGAALQFGISYPHLHTS